MGTMSGKKRKPTPIKDFKNIVSITKKHNKPIFVKQIEINKKLEKDINKFPEILKYRDFFKK